MISLQKWPDLSPHDLPGLDRATKQIHIAAQFLSMAGQFFLERQADDSHTNMGWDPEKAWFITQKLPTSSGHALALRPATLELLLVNNQGAAVQSCQLPGKTQAEGVAWVNLTLAALGLDTSGYQIDLHYDIPDHELQHGATFQSLLRAYQVFSNVRTIGHLVITEFSAPFPHASPVKTWPHHFDIASYIPLQFGQDQEAEKSISIGMAIQDGYVDDHYFYITHWSKSGKIQYDSLPVLPSGGKWNPNGLKGAVLPLSDLVSAGEKNVQIKSATEFMKAGIQASIHLLGLNPEEFR